ncbi:hypothetical protein WA026_016273 [Henosepilachna vigintioctopunctata]|uniref:Uncharacterized protein n=1 Tax=Henosepilachna vigintioctopunctata TaxID=420089 RepID=A0AAW1UCI6_9CUCU
MLKDAKMPAEKALIPGFVLTVPRKEFVSEWLKYGSKDKNECLLIYILKLGNKEEDKITNIRRIKDAIKNYSKKISDRWEKCHRRADVFFKEFSTWLEGNEFEFEFEFVISQFTLQVLASADGKSNILCETRITTTDGRIFEIPKEHMNASHHKELTKTPAYTKVKNACSQRGHLRRVWINLTNDLRNTYCDEDDNIQFNEGYLEEINEKDGDATANASEQSLVKLLEKILEKSQKETEQNSGKLANEFAIDKFDGRNVNTQQWWGNFDKECERFECNEITCE